ncbi:hypothetical protein WH158_13510 [Gluconobacter cerinus]|uniref:hypothetical protein n=1 Tax=Gluconobacter cerinus TaxID=38307 RepID=UPI0030AC5759
MQWSDLLGLLPPQVLFWSGIFLVLASVLLNVCGFLRSRIAPPAPGSRWARPYQLLSFLAFEQKYAAAMYKIGLTAVMTTRAEAPLLKKAGADSGVQILDSKGKPKAPT